MMVKWSLKNLNDIIEKLKEVMDDAQQLKVGEFRPSLDKVYNKMIVLKGLMVCRDWPQQIETKVSPDFMYLFIIAIQQYISRVSINEWDESDLAQINFLLYETDLEFSRWINEYSKQTSANYQSILDNLVRNF